MNVRQSVRRVTDVLRAEPPAGPDDFIVERGALRHRFTENVRSEPPHALMVFHGLRKSGTTSFLEHLQHVYREMWTTTHRSAFVNASELGQDPEPEPVLSCICDQLGDLLLLRFPRYSRLLDELVDDRASISVYGARLESIGRTASGALEPAAEAGNLALGGPKGLGKAASRPFKQRFRRTVDSMTNTKASSWATGALEGLQKADPQDRQITRRRREEIQRMLAPALAEDLIEGIGGRAMVRQAAIIIDHYHELEWRADVADSISVLAQKLYEAKANVILVLGRRGPIQTARARSRWIPIAGDYWRDGRRQTFGHFTLGDRIEVHQIPLLGDWNARYYLAQKGIDPCSADEAIELAGGHPLALRLAADALQARGSGASLRLDKSDYGIDSEPPEKWVPQLCRDLASEVFDDLPDQRKQLMRAASLPRRFNEELLAHVMGPTLSEEDYDWLVDSDFVEPALATAAPVAAPLHRMMTYVRVAALRSERERRLMDRWNKRLVEYFQMRRDTLLANTDEAFLYDVELVYHQHVLTPTNAAVAEFEEMLDEALREDRDDRCSVLLLALHDLRPTDQALHAKTLELEGRFYTKRQKYELAERRLRTAQEKLPVGSKASRLTASITYSLARCLRLRGDYRGALEELDGLKTLAEDDPPLAYLVTWHQSLANKMLDETDEARRLCEEGRRLLAAAADANQTTSPLGFSIRDTARTGAHLDRHDAELRRRQGDFGGAHKCVERALASYKGQDRPEDEAIAHARLTRANTLRLEGLLRDAAVDALWALDCFVAMGRRHGELMARRVLGEIEMVRDPADAWDYFGTLVDQPRWIFPSGPAQGHLGLAELYRRVGRQADAEEHLTRARAESGTGASVAAIEARIGLAAVWCATGEAAAAAREARLVAKEPLAACNPLLRFYADLIVAYADPPRRDAVFADAEVLLDGFLRRPEDQRLFEQQLSHAAAGAALDDIAIVHL